MTGAALQQAHHGTVVEASGQMDAGAIDFSRKPSKVVKVAELTGHTSRVLHMAQSPDGTTVVSAAADETLRFWRILGPDAAERRCESASVLGPAAWKGASASTWTIR